MSAVLADRLNVAAAILRHVSPAQLPDELRGELGPVIDDVLEAAAQLRAAPHDQGRVMSKPTRTEGEPHDRLTRISDAMSNAMESHPEYQDGDKCVVFLDSDAEKRGGLVMFGYEDDRDAIAAIFSHLKAVFEVNGMRLDLLPFDKPIGQG